MNANPIRVLMAALALTNSILISARVRQDLEVEIVMKTSTIVYQEILA